MFAFTHPMSTFQSLALSAKLEGSGLVWLIYERKANGFLIKLSRDQIKTEKFQL